MLNPFRQDYRMHRMIFEPQRTQTMRIAKGIHEEHPMARMSKLILALQDLLMEPDSSYRAPRFAGSSSDLRLCELTQRSIWLKTTSGSAFVCGRLRLICRTEPVPENAHL
jgi:hypothetical protein